MPREPYSRRVPRSSSRIMRSLVTFATPTRPLRRPRPRHPSTSPGPGPQAADREAVGEHVARLAASPASARRIPATLHTCRPSPVDLRGRYGDDAASPGRRPSPASYAAFRAFTVSVLESASSVSLAPARRPNSDRRYHKGPAQAPRPASSIPATGTVRPSLDPLVAAESAAGGAHNPPARSPARPSPARLSALPLAWRRSTPRTPAAAQPVPGPPFQPGQRTAPASPAVNGS